jgi:hypothetical protein
VAGVHDLARQQQHKHEQQREKQRLGMGHLLRTQDLFFQSAYAHHTGKDEIPGLHAGIHETARIQSAETAKTPLRHI